MEAYNRVAKVSVSHQCHCLCFASTLLKVKTEPQGVILLSLMFVRTVKET